MAGIWTPAQRGKPLLCLWRATSLLCTPQQTRPAFCTRARRIRPYVCRRPQMYDSSGWPVSFVGGDCQPDAPPTVATLCTESKRGTSPSPQLHQVAKYHGGNGRHDGGRAHDQVRHVDITRAPPRLKPTRSRQDRQPPGQRYRSNGGWARHCKRGKSSQRTDGHSVSLLPSMLVLHQCRSLAARASRGPAGVHKNRLCRGSSTAAERGQIACTSSRGRCPPLACAAPCIDSPGRFFSPSTNGDLHAPLHNGHF